MADIITGILMPEKELNDTNNIKWIFIVLNVQSLQTMILK